VTEERRDFLPPEPAGPEPELEPSRPQAPAPPPQPPPAYPTTQQFPPPPQQPPPPPGYPPYGWQQQAPPPGWGYPPAAPQPDNGPAVTGFVLSLVSAGLLFVSGGISSIVSVGCSIAAIIYARKGKAKVERGETQKNRGLAQAGFVIGIVGLVLAVLATLVWGIILVALIADDQFRQDFENEFDNSNSINAALRLAAGGARLLIG
jgi:hypothetical protein